MTDPFIERLCNPKARRIRRPRRMTKRIAKKYLKSVGLWYDKRRSQAFVKTLIAESMVVAETVYMDREIFERKLRGEI